MIFWGFSSFIFLDLNETADGRYLTKFQQAVLCCCCSELLQLFQCAPPEGTASDFCVIISEADCIQHLLE